MIIKKVMYHNYTEALFADGKFLYIFVDNPENHGRTLYFTHNGKLYKAVNVIRHITADEIELAYDGYMAQVLDDRMHAYEPCKSLKEAFIQMQKTQYGFEDTKRLMVSINYGDVVLVHRLNVNFINIYYGYDTERLAYNDGIFKYSAGSDIAFDGFPDLQDSSTEMNLMLCGASVQNMQVLVQKFKEYTKLMDIKY